VKQAVLGGPDDGSRRHQDKAAFQAATKIFDLLVAVLVGLIGGTGRDSKRQQSGGRPYQIDQAFHGVGKKTYRTREKIRRKFKQDGGYRRADG
jgi:hypothetical protein